VGGDSLIDVLGVVRAIGSERRKASSDLSQELRHGPTVMDATPGEFDRSNLTRACIDSEMQLAPATISGRLAAVSRMHTNARAVDEQMDRP